MGLAVTAGMQLTANAIENSRSQETLAEMTRLATAISGNPNLYANGVRLDFGYVGDIGALPAILGDLVTNPGYATWDGPYLSVDYSNYSTDYLYDAWGVAYDLSGVEIRSFGLGGDTLRVRIAANAAQLVGNSISGAVTNSNGGVPGAQAGNVQIVLTYPNGSGNLRDSTITPSGDGSFTFAGFVPCGNHRLRAIFTTANDTSETIVSVLPGSATEVLLRLSGLPIALAPAEASRCLAGHHLESLQNNRLEKNGSC
jgi:hypothetical protein